MLDALLTDGIGLLARRAKVVTGVWCRRADEAGYAGVAEDVTLDKETSVTRCQRSGAGLTARERGRIPEVAQADDASRHELTLSRWILEWP